ncbi:MAG: MDR family oxidoreductase [Gemmatimonadota bacterium]
MFRALVMEAPDGGAGAQVRQVREEDLPGGDVTVQVECSSLNYKDGMVLTGLGNLVKTYPHVPGIDLAGAVVESADARWRAGDRVLLTGWGVGEARWGGYAERARARGEWLVPLPDGWSAREAMGFGTAGLTAMLAVMSLEEHGLRPGAERRVLVTGAGGGVGSLAVALLSELGYEVAAGTGRPELGDYLRSLGASRIISREKLAQAPQGPLGAQRWAGCIDAVGGSTLARVLSEVEYGGSVAAVGLTGGRQLHTTVIPFLLRGVRLLGIDSVMCPLERRQEAWRRLAATLPAARLGVVIAAARLEDLPRLAAQILAGQVRGRVVVEVRA